MPPRYAYWTIIVDDQPTAFRAALLEDLMPTFNRLKQKSPSAVLKWFQNGQLWPSRLDAREAMRARGEQGRRKDPRQRDAWRAGASAPARRGTWKPRPADEGKPFGGGKPSGLPDQPKPTDGKLEWKPKDPNAPPPPPRSARPSSDRPAWRPKGKPEGRPAFKPRERRDDRGAKPEWKPKSGAFARKPSGDRPARPAFKPRDEKPEWKPRGASEAGAGDKPRDKKWRPGGAHEDPRQKYKDAKKAKWTRFKQAIRARAGHKKKPDK